MTDGASKTEAGRTLVERGGEYRTRGDYHRELDPNWSYAPIYREKLRHVDAFLATLAPATRLVDVGAGEGRIVERARARGLDAIGVDAAYASAIVRRASILELPFEDATFGAALCLDVLEHLPLLDQPKALAEIHRVLAPGGRLLLTMPNLAHLHSRLRFFLGGRLTRTSAVERHPGDRPLAETLELLEASGLDITKRSGIFPTLPLAFRLVNRHPARWGWLVPLLDRLLPLPGIAFLAVVEAEKR